MGDVNNIDHDAQVSSHQSDIVREVLAVCVLGVQPREDVDCDEVQGDDLHPASLHSSCKL